MHRLWNRILHKRPILIAQLLQLLPRLPSRGLQLLGRHFAELAHHGSIDRGEPVVQVRRAPRRVLRSLVPVRVRCGDRGGVGARQPLGVSREQPKP